MLLAIIQLKPFAFGGICNAAVQHNRICNPAMQQCSNYTCALHEVRGKLPMFRAALQMPLNRTLCTAQQSQTCNNSTSQ